jgi:diaminopimelate decarboxylase
MNGVICVVTEAQCRLCKAQMLVVADSVPDLERLCNACVLSEVRVTVRGTPSPSTVTTGELRLPRRPGPAA